MVCGGTGLYVDSLMAGRTFAPYPETGKRQELERLAAEQGIDAVMAILREHDPESAARIEPANQKRVIRAAEVFLETGKTITQHNLETQMIPPKYDPLWIGLDFTDRAELYARIDKRVDIMVADGLLPEIEGLLAEGIPATSTSLQAIGYKEPMAALRGEMTMEEAIEKIKTESRRYAKRQLTWFRRNPKINWVFNQEPVTFAKIWEQVQRIIGFDSIS